MAERIPVDIKGIDLELADCGEDHVGVILHLPDGRKVELGYSAYHGTLDVCMYEPAEGEADMGDGYTSRECWVTNWTDKKDKNGKYVSSMHNAPKAPEGCGEHQRMATQLVISVGESQEVETHRVTLRHSSHTKAVREALADLGLKSVYVEGLTVMVTEAEAEALVAYFKQCMDQPSTARQFQPRQRRLRELIEKFTI